MIAAPTAETAAWSPADPAWDDAFLRVQSYLRAHGLESPQLLNHLTAEIIQEAREAGSGEDPMGAAMRITHARIGAWFARSGVALDWSDERIRTQGRLALIVANLPGRWPHQFLSAGPVPPELAAALTSYRLLAGPELSLSGMSAAPLEFGLIEPDDPRLPVRRFWVASRAAVSWLVIVGFFGVAWAASH